MTQPSSKKIKKPNTGNNSPKLTQQKKKLSDIERGVFTAEPSPRGSMRYNFDAIENVEISIDPPEHFLSFDNSRNKANPLLPNNNLLVPQISQGVSPTSSVNITHNNGSKLNGAFGDSMRYIQPSTQIGSSSHDHDGSSKPHSPLSSPIRPEREQIENHSEITKLT